MTTQPASHLNTRAPVDTPSHACRGSRQGSLTAFRSAAGPSLAAASVFLLPITSRLGVGGPTGDLSSLLTIAGSPAYAMVGAAAVLSALYRAPLTGSLLLFELTKVRCYCCCSGFYVGVLLLLLVLWNRSVGLDWMCGVVETGLRNSPTARACFALLALSISSYCSFPVVSAN